MPAPKTRKFHGRPYWFEGTYSSERLAQAIAAQMEAGNEARCRVTKGRDGWSVWWRSK